MNFSETFIRRPVLTLVVSTLILLLGIQGYLGMNVREYPEVEESVITVTTIYPGASADLMQGFITTPIAKAVLNADNVDYVGSSSTLGSSTVTVNMLLGSDPDQALIDVLSKVQQVRGELPTDAEDPVVIKGNGQNFALMYLAVRSSTMNPQQVTEYLTQVVQPRFTTVEGVGAVDILGGRDFAMRIWLDPIRLAAREVTASEVVAAIRSSNFLSAPGKTENEFVAYSIETATTLQTPETFGELPVRAVGDEIIRLRDVARVELGAASDDVKVMFNGEEGTFLAVSASPDANPLNTSAGLREQLPQIQRELPPGMELELVYDATETITESITEVFKTIAEAVAIVVLVILLFLGSFRSVIIPIVAIPLSLVGVCFILFALGYSINLLTLLAMVLAIGLVVDDAIVVVENINRHLEEGLAPLDAALVGMREIFAPVVGDDDHARRRLRPDRVHHRAYGRVVSRVRLHARRVGHHLWLCRGDAVADAGEPHPQAARREAKPLPGLRRSQFQPAEQLVRSARRRLAAVPRRHRDDRRGPFRDHGVPVPKHFFRTGPRRGPGIHVLGGDRSGLCDRRVHATFHLCDERRHLGCEGDRHALLHCGDRRR
jgi:multidrug efflux pump